MLYSVPRVFSACWGSSANKHLQKPSRCLPRNRLTRGKTKVGRSCMAGANRQENEPLCYGLLNSVNGAGSCDGAAVSSCLLQPAFLRGPPPFCRLRSALLAPPASPLIGDRAVPPLQHPTPFFSSHLNSIFDLSLGIIMANTYRMMSGED